MDDRIELSIGPALDTLSYMLSTPHDTTVDFAFIDADKGNYVNYYDLCIQLVRPGGMVTLDNTLFKVIPCYSTAIVLYASPRARWWSLLARRKQSALSNMLTSSSRRITELTCLCSILEMGTPLQ